MQERYQKIYNEIIKNMDSNRVFLNESLKKYTSFKIGGPADIFAIIKASDEIKYILEIAKNENIPINIIGNGTNILVRDAGIRGIVLKIETEGYKIDGKNIYVDSGMSISKAVMIAQKAGLTGLEFAYGIPR